MVDYRDRLTLFPLLHDRAVGLCAKPIGLPPVRLFPTLIALLIVLIASPAAHARDRWTPEQAQQWYAAQQWHVGANYLPSNAINQLEMWQADTFDPVEIDKEFGWAQQIGMTSMRVFLHDLLWRQDRAGLVKRMNTLLDIADRHHIKILFVLFDSCWDPHPKLGPQHPPIPGVHNSGWVQSPGTDALQDPAQIPRLEAYVKGIIGTFAHDKRILGWDLWNEPDNLASQYPGQPSDKVQLVEKLLPEVFEWARSVDPEQPLTSGVWGGYVADWSDPEQLIPMEKIQLAQSDVISFHDYGWPESMRARIKQLETYGRPVFCTEYMARGAGSTFDGSLPVGWKHDVAMFNWGFVRGKEQTWLPWDSWERPYVLSEPSVWFHDVLYRDGRPYREAEVELIHHLSQTPPPAQYGGD
ncbi:cellulase family glycosylhydrolase [Tsuneonella mangrovi]|uniref:cellulase family glycosylhydrolase n=1 Tax=Tsuneonella mangrovi TaxID=1982042 RepID=UPI0012379AD9|nr:cellulase family glycosylhydrolase [Tsuneonella mangrovi]